MAEHWWEEEEEDNSDDDGWDEEEEDDDWYDWEEEEDDDWSGWDDDDDDWSSGFDDWYDDWGGGDGDDDPDTSGWDFVSDEDGDGVDDGTLPDEFFEDVGEWDVGDLGELGEYGEVDDAFFGFDDSGEPPPEIFADMDPATYDFDVEDLTEFDDFATPEWTDDQAVWDMPPVALTDDGLPIYQIDDDLFSVPGIGEFSGEEIFGGDAPMNVPEFLTQQAVGPDEFDIGDDIDLDQMNQDFESFAGEQPFREASPEMMAEALLETPEMAEQIAALEAEFDQSHMPTDDIDRQTGEELTEDIGDESIEEQIAFGDLGQEMGASPEEIVDDVATGVTDIGEALDAMIAEIGPIPDAGESADGTSESVMAAGAGPQIQTVSEDQLPPEEQMMLEQAPINLDDGATVVRIKGSDYIMHSDGTMTDMMGNDVPDVMAQQAGVPTGSQVPRAPAGTAWDPVSRSYVPIAQAQQAAQANDQRIGAIQGRLAQLDADPESGAPGEYERLETELSQREKYATAIGNSLKDALKTPGGASSSGDLTTTQVDENTTAYTQVIRGPNGEPIDTQTVIFRTPPKFGWAVDREGNLIENVAMDLSTGRVFRTNDDGSLGERLPIQDLISVRYATPSGVKSLVFGEGTGARAAQQSASRPPGMPTGSRPPAGGGRPSGGGRRGGGGGGGGGGRNNDAQIELAREKMAQEASQFAETMALKMSELAQDQSQFESNMRVTYDKLALEAEVAQARADEARRAGDLQAASFEDSKARFAEQAAMELEKLGLNRSQIEAQIEELRAQRALREEQAQRPQVVQMGNGIYLQYDPVSKTWVEKTTSAGQGFSGARTTGRGLR